MKSTEHRGAKESTLNNIEQLATRTYQQEPINANNLSTCLILMLTGNISGHAPQHYGRHFQNVVVTQLTIFSSNKCHYLRCFVCSLTKLNYKVQNAVIFKVIKVFTKIYGNCLDISHLLQGCFLCQTL